jgi:uncharacterized DUF497 family protein
MEIEFDPSKDAANIAKHGVSLAAAADLEILFAEVDPRFTAETRHRGLGLLNGKPHFVAFMVTARGMRVISLRRAHLKEYLRYVEG